MTIKRLTGLGACSAALLLLVSAAPVVAADGGGAGSAEVGALIERLGLEESAVPVRDLPGWRKPRRVLVSGAQPELLPRLQAAAPGVELLLARDMAEAVRLAKDADAVLGFCSAELLEAGRDIRWIQS